MTLQVHGPAAYRKDAPNQYHVVTKDLDGRPLSTNLTVRALDAEQKVLFKQDVANPGEVVVALPTALDTVVERGSCALKVEAHTASAREGRRRTSTSLGRPTSHR